MSPKDLSRYADVLLTLERSNMEQARLSESLAPKRSFHQPVHVVYGGAHLFKSDTIKKLTKLASDSFDSFITDAQKLKSVLREDWSEAFSTEVFTRLSSKLKTSPIEDFRIDFEDGYGARTDLEEDEHAKTAAEQLAAGLKNLDIECLIGIRVKPLSMATTKRSLRTLLIFLDTLNQSKALSEGKLHRFIVTLPKVTNEAQVASLAAVLGDLEQQWGLSHGFFQVELLIEAPQAILSVDGSVQLPKFMQAAAGRCIGLHLGVYDLNSSLGLGSSGQDIENNVCEFVRMWMLISGGLSQGVYLSDGIINILPVAKHRSVDGKGLTPEQALENENYLGSAWRFNYERMLNSLKKGFYQGWDLHPSQVAIRHVANHAYVLKELDSVCKRLSEFIKSAAKANLVGSVFDDKASVLGLINFLQRALNSKIVSQEELLAKGVDWEIAKKLGFGSEGH